MATTKRAGAAQLPERITAIPAGRASQLFRWNRALIALHGIQALIIVLISPTDAKVNFEGSYPVAKIVDGVFAGLTTGTKELFGIPLAYVVAAFFGLSALAHFLVAFPLRERYERWLAQSFNPM